VRLLMLRACHRAVGRTWMARWRWPGSGP
jgi:hypothetical protein